jgi:pyrroline-5-carboxylate reductase
MPRGDMDNNSYPVTGFIGYGSMGSMLVIAFLEEGVLVPDQVIISTRGKSHCSALLRQYPGITIAYDNQELVQKADRSSSA